MNRNIETDSDAYARKVRALSTLYPASRGSRFMEDAVSSALSAWCDASGYDADIAREARETYEILRHLMSEGARNGHF